MKADSKRIRQLMQQAHMAVRDVARAADLPPQTAAAIICGMNVQPDTLVRIAQVLGVGLEEIAVGVVLKTKGRAGGDPRREILPPLPTGQVRVDTARFAEALARSGLTAAQLAKRAGVSPGVVRHIARGAEEHKAETVDKLADALGVAVYHITRRDGGMT